VDDRGLIFRAVDPDRVGQEGHARWAVDEAPGLVLVRAVHGGLPLRQDGRRIAVMHRGRCQEGEPGVPVLLVVVLKERGTPHLGVSEVVEALRIRGRVFGGLELRLGKWVAIADPRSRQRSDDPQVLIQRVQVLRRLNAAAITVRGQLPGDDAMALTGRANQPLRQGSRFAPRQHPRDDVATEEIEDHIERVAFAFDRTSVTSQVHT